VASRRRKWDEELEDEFPGKEDRHRKRLDKRKRNGREADLFNRAGKKKRGSKSIADEPREDTRFGRSSDSYLDELLADDEIAALDFELDVSHGSDDRLGSGEVEDYEIDYSSDDWE
jgi:hypothetical protein